MLLCGLKTPPFKKGGVLRSGVASDGGARNFDNLIPSQILDSALTQVLGRGLFGSADGPNPVKEKSLQGD